MASNKAFIKISGKMRNFLSFGILILVNSGLHSQTGNYQKEYEQWRTEYINEFKTSDNSPLKKSQLKDLRFFPADSMWRIPAVFMPTPGKQPREFPTSSGSVKSYLQVGILTFKINEISYSLVVFKRVLPPGAPADDYVFVPFKDYTNGEFSYGGGRYMDFKMSDLLKTPFYIDFNKAYNPYCAYTDGYSCPIPPDENYLNTEIKAGEMNFGAGEQH